MTATASSTRNIVRVLRFENMLTDFTVDAKFRKLQLASIVRAHHSRVDSPTCVIAQSLHLILIFSEDCARTGSCDVNVINVRLRYGLNHMQKDARHMRGSETWSSSRYQATLPSPPSSGATEARGVSVSLNSRTPLYGLAAGKN